MPSIVKLKLDPESAILLCTSLTAKINESFCIVLEQYRHEINRAKALAKPFGSAGQQLPVTFIKQYVMSLESQGN